MKKRYVVVGLGVATLVAVTVVVVGPGAGSGGSNVGVEPQTGQSLPAAHSSVAASSPSDSVDSSRASGTSDSLRKMIAQLEKAHAAHPRDTAVLLKLGDADFLGQRYQAAAWAYQSVLLIKPTNATAKVHLAMVWHAEGQIDRATKAIKAVLAKAPNDQAAHYSLAIVYFSANRVDEARMEWAKAAKIDPNSTIGRRSQSFVDLLEGN